MAPSTLLMMAQAACIRDIAGLIDIGDMSYELARPILKRIRDAAQLHNIEVASPHIADHDAELWKAFIARDIPQWRDKIIEPKNPRSWWKVHRKLVREEEAAKQEQEQQLLATMKGLEQKKVENKLNFVNQVLSYPKSAELLPGQHFVNNIPETPRPTLRNAKLGKDIIHAIRKDVVSAKRDKGLLGTMSTNKSLKYGIAPIKTIIKAPKAQITKAPAGMIRDHQMPKLTPAAQKLASQHTPRPQPKIFASRTVQTKTDRVINAAILAEQKNREDRLRALAAGKPVPMPTPPPSQSSPPPPSRPRPATSQPRQSTSQLAGQKRKADSDDEEQAPEMARSTKVTRTTEPILQDTKRSERATTPLATATGTSTPTRSSPGPVVRKRVAVSIFMPKKKKI